MATDDPRGRMVQSATVLLARAGVAGASFAHVLAHSGAPRGSIYHHFPDGKDQLVAEAVALAGARAVAALDHLAGGSPVEVLDGFVGMWRAVLERSSFGVGCSVLGTVVTDDSAARLDQADGVFRAWRDRLARLFADAGLDGDARGVATLVIASTEGAVVLARAARDLEPLETVHAQLRAVVGAARGGS
ncbi:TetR/AcrR family transcriptional regulator [Cellulomonas sp. ICMP 17802]|uniref:TetR/AcrR family transcriptional regulator n=1 Tax=Cellulomonas sp. ICMP 17802 TaxID=3239199 RepID=UPI00351BAE51